MQPRQIDGFLLTIPSDSGRVGVYEKRVVAEVDWGIASEPDGIGGGADISAVAGGDGAAVAGGGVCVSGAASRGIDCALEFGGGLAVAERGHCAEVWGDAGAGAAGAAEAGVAAGGMSGPASGGCPCGLSVIFGCAEAGWTLTCWLGSIVILIWRLRLRAGRFANPFWPNWNWKFSTICLYAQ